MEEHWYDTFSRHKYGHRDDYQENKDRNPMTADRHQIATYLTNYALSELVKYVMEDTGCDVEQAMDRVYNSSIMPALQDEENELYVQSPAYLYELMQQ